jgi:hypothetical protein
MSSPYAPSWQLPNTSITLVDSEVIYFRGWNEIKARTPSIMITEQKI